MGRKRKRKRIPPPPATICTSSVYETERQTGCSTPLNKSSTHPGRASTAYKRRQLSRPWSSQKAMPTARTAPISHKVWRVTSSGPRGAVAVPGPLAPVDDRIPNSAPSNPSPPIPNERYPTTSSSCSEHSADDAASMKSSEILAQLLPLGGWKLASCWAYDCKCATFLVREMVGGSGRVATRCCCGHRAVAHELVDSSLHDDHRASPPHRVLREYHSVERFRAGSAMVQSKTLVLLRRLFAAIRNARAVGDCGLFQDSQGVDGWGSGWFLSRLGSEYLQQAKQAAAQLNGGLHDAPAVERSLSTAEALMSGDAPKEWAVPDSLPLTAVYKALGTGVASALDIAYFHVRYSAVSRFDAGGTRATADAATPVMAAVPPPEVYFLCLAFHVPSMTDLLAMPGIDNPALRDMLTRVFDLRADIEGFHRLGPSGSTSGTHGDELRFPVLENPLLAVTQSTWLETAVSAAPRAWVPFFPPRFGEPEGTMRGSDPALPYPIRARCDATRDWLARLYAFAVPNRRAVEACQRALGVCGGPGSGIVEVGAGLGYWKWVLENASSRIRAASPTPLKKAKRDDAARVRREAGASVVAGKDPASPLRILAIDKNPAKRLDSTNTSIERRGNGRDQRGGASGRRARGGRGQRAGPQERQNEYHGGAPAWASVKEGGPELLRSMSGSDFPALLLCYPPPSISGGSVDGRPGSCMGADALGHFLGEVVLYVGEVGGDTGSPCLEEALRAGWDMVEDVELPCYASTANRLMTFIRKGSALLQRPAKSAAEDASSRERCADLGSESHDAEIETAESWSKPLAMYRCERCGEVGREKAPLRRCRLTRAVVYCSEGCFVAHSENWRANLQARHAHVAGLVFGSGGVFRDKKLFKRLGVRSPNSRSFS